jgi:hypothetical protein
VTPRSRRRQTQWSGTEAGAAASAGRQGAVVSGADEWQQQLGPDLSVQPPLQHCTQPTSRPLKSGSTGILMEGAQAQHRVMLQANAGHG